MPTLPTPTILMDRLEGAQVTLGSTTLNATRSMIVTNIDTTAPELALIKAVTAVPGMPQTNELFPDFLFTRLTKHRVLPLSGTVARVFCDYEGPAGDEIPQWVIEETSQLSGAGVSQIPDTHEPITVQWTSDGKDANGNAVTRILTQVGTINSMVPTRCISYSRLNSPFPAFYRSLFGCVNSVPWGLGASGEVLPAGYWLFAGANVMSPNQGVTFNYKFTFMSKTDCDWGDYCYYRMAEGQNIPVQQEILAALAATYTHDCKQGFSKPGYAAGISKTGKFRLADFSPMFGT